MWVQAFVVFDAHPVVDEPRFTLERGFDPSRRILAEHEIGGVQPRELLLILAFDRGLHRRLDSFLDGVD